MTNTFPWFGELIGTARSDFHKKENAFATRNDIDFTLWSAVIPINDFVAVFAQKMAGGFFAEVPDVQLFDFAHFHLSGATNRVSTKVKITFFSSAFPPEYLLE